MTQLLTQTGRPSLQLMATLVNTRNQSPAFLEQHVTASPKQWPLTCGWTSEVMT